ncbi:LysM peptidoglycan-binding domain-containing protein [Actinoplanes sp. NPDC051494]|uniref:LysM peptidoglycan-binding domain-containing protein n=1 Tax=Actinoplanes sp. NPDC051494 TaxID=3363907 RepID=UPI00379DFC8B
MRGKEYAVVATGVRPARPVPLRLTRRGRIVVLAVLFLLATLASAVLWTTASRADETPTGPTSTVVVQPDDSLWSIAARVAPDRSRERVVREIRHLNGIPGSDIYAGETLVVPPRG